MKELIYLFIALSVSSCVTIEKPKETDLPNLDRLSHLELPDGFSIEYYAENVKDARSMCLSEDEVLFVGTYDEGKVYALTDQNKDQKADTIYVIAEGLNMPNGVALQDGDLYIAEVSRISVIRDVHDHLHQLNTPEIIYDGFPTDRHHGWKYIAFGPDGHLYVPIGAPCNVCERSDPIYSTITRLDITGGEPEIIARGIRNSVGFNWQPETELLWFTDNGRDMMGDNMPGDELNLVKEEGTHFGFPYCHQGDTPDPKFGEGHDCEDYQAPVQVLGPHVAALGLEFYRSGQFPNDYSESIFIAEHGSWNRSEPIGYRISRVELDGERSVNYEPFISGWLRNGEALGRPVDLEWMPDGSLLISDDQSGCIYRVVYNQ